MAEVQSIDVEQLFAEFPDLPLVDVRTPAEYEKGHIPQAFNMPLFTNEERAVVGMLYKQQSAREAFLRGLEFVGPKMRSFVEEAESLAPHRQIALHCWRGGQRSSSVGWLLERSGFSVKTLRGGYKAFRHLVLDWFRQHPYPIIILGGPTGSGKTDILKALAAQGEQVIDLEGLANHKGSAFGALGQAPQPTVEHFENLLFDAFRRMDPHRRIWLENESRSVGRTYIQRDLWKQMLQAPLIHLEIPLEARVERLVREYACYPGEELRRRFEKIRKRLGGQHLKAALEALDRGDYHAAARIGLRYYDKAYAMSLERRSRPVSHSLEVKGDDPETTASQLLTYADARANLQLPLGIA